MSNNSQDVTHGICFIIGIHDKFVSYCILAILSVALIFRMCTELLNKAEVPFQMTSELT